MYNGCTQFIGNSVNLLIRSIFIACNVATVSTIYLWVKYIHPSVH